MKAKYHQVPKQTNTTFSIRHDILPQFGTVWHYHPEIELHYLIKGQGMRFIGENITDFYDDEVILMGSNIPHMWKGNNQDEDGNYYCEDYMFVKKQYIFISYYDLNGKLTSK